MSNLIEFEALMGRVRLGDQDAATELVRRFEPEIRRKARSWIRIRGPEQRTVFESMDICQSVLASFFRSVEGSSYELDRPDQVLALLLAMIRHKVSKNVRDGRRLCRDARRNRPLGDEVAATTTDETPSGIVANRDLLQEFEAGLSEEESRIARLRLGGADWTSVAAETGGTPESCRKKWSRVIVRAAHRLGFASDGP